LLVNKFSINLFIQKGLQKSN